MPTFPSHSHLHLLFPSSSSYWSCHSCSFFSLLLIPPSPISHSLSSGSEGWGFFFFFKQGHLMKIHIKVECSCQFTTTVRFINHCVMRSLRISVSSALISRIRTNEHLSCDVCFIQGWGTGKDNCVLLVFFWGTHRQFDWSYLGSKILFFLALEWGWHPLLISLCGIKIHEDQYRIVIGNVTSYILIMLLVIEIE